MPEDSNKNDRKNAKEQRKPRQRRQQEKFEKKSDKVEDSNRAPKVPQKPPVYESPPPEFFKNLKRETDEILKITEEENSKYKKKEIQSNWSKYEIPINSYEDIDEQENMGADYEKLIQTPLNAGGHFQFKHEKSWDITTGSSQYDKYFEIDMNDLNIAICTIPFYKRNKIDQSTFKETDILTMNNRANKFKQKYYNDKSSYSTPETIVHDKIMNILRDDTKSDNTDTKLENKCNVDFQFDNINDDKAALKTEDEVININDTTDSTNNKPHSTVNSNEKIENTEKVPPSTESVIKSNVTATLVEDIEYDDFIFGTTEKTAKTFIGHVEKPIIFDDVANLKTKQTDFDHKPVFENKVAISVKHDAHIVAEQSLDTKENAVIESHEDLEKWLDDFLDS